MNYDEIIASIDFSAKQSAESFPPSNFSEINEKDEEVTFIDGGSGEIFSSANFSLAFFRIFSCTYSGAKMKSSEKKEFFALVTASSGTFRTKIFGSGPAIPDLPDPSGNRVGILKTIDIIRRAAEIEMACTASGHAVMDGNLRAENDFIKEKLSKCNACALSKTNELLTESGNPIGVELMKTAPFRQWSYYPATKQGGPFHKAETAILKLHPFSKYTFKLETPGKDFSIIKALAFNAKDPVFLGYPFGLVQADRFARVSNEEISHLRIKLSARNEAAISQYLNTMNAHSILDKVS